LVRISRGPPLRTTTWFLSGPHIRINDHHSTR
jgi:hypothetical protein